MDVLLVEDEPPALARLEEGLRACAPEARVVGRLGSVRETVAWLRAHPGPDLVLMDLQLSDGLSLEVFRQVELQAPVIVVTAYDQHVLEALALNCIDYLLKPVRQERLAAAIGKYRQLERHFAGDLRGLLRDLDRPRGARRERLLARRGLDFVPVQADDVAWFSTEHKLVFLRHRAGAQYLVDQPLAELEAQLDPARFFRLNRKYLAHAAAICSFRPADKGRLAVTLEPAPAEPVLVSQERAAAFREWMERRR